MDIKAFFSERYLVASSCQTIACFTFVLARFILMWPSAHTGGGFIHFVASLIWTIGSIVFTQDYANSARTRGIAPSNDRSTVANLFFSIAGVLASIGSFLVMFEASHPAGLAFLMLFNCVFIAGAICLLVDAIALAEGWLILEDRYTLTGFCYSLGGGFSLIGIFMMFGEGSYEAGAASFWVGSMLMTFSAVLFSLEMRGLAVADVSDPITGYASGPAADAYSSLEEQGVAPQPDYSTAPPPPAGNEWDQDAGVTGWKEEEGI